MLGWIFHMKRVLFDFRDGYNTTSFMGTVRDGAV